MLEHRGIPTQYKGVNFRSRLEAKYAALFDLLAWSWTYEPIDLAGWIPDFAIEGKPRPILVEVKPIFEFDEALGDRIVRAADCLGEGGYETLISGAVLPENIFGIHGPGWLCEGDWWSPAHVFEVLGIRPTKYGLCHDLGSYQDRISGLHDGDHYLGDSPDLEAMWVEAGNIVQWQAVAPRVR
jgi:hypothetical protein